MGFFSDLKEFVAPTGPRPTPQKYFLLPDGYAAAQFCIADDVFYSIYIGLNHWENKSTLPEGSKVHNRETAMKAALQLDEMLKERLLNAITATSASKGAGFFVKIRGAVKYDVQYTNEEDFLAQKRELLLQGYKVDDKLTYYLDSKVALKSDNHKLIIDKEWDYSCEYAKRAEAKEHFLKKVCQEILHDDFATAPDERF
ncbi:MAG: hypothetical protein HUK05_03395 [Prevotella sp.]|nr:hypothetical protein [Prevotella sp.]MCF0209550.1 hypothetical protein [Bacteroidaceae bacterium]